MEEMHRQFTHNDAMIELNAIQARIMQSGSVDAELDMLSDILQELEKKKISPEGAIKKARRLEAGRQDYH